MDLIGAITTQLGIDATQAEALAGTVLGGVRSQVEDEMGPEAAAKLDAQVPELDRWQARSAAATPSNGGPLGALSGGVGGALLGALGGEQAKQAAQLGALFQAAGLDASKASLVAPLLLSFLKERMPEEWLDRALGAAPLLGALAGAETTPNALGALGGLLGGDA